ncbi:MAG: hypothetical protein ACRDDY_00155 [Clostridium sp.]|uniref:hypothetical protein n=1 Tax=Clostridium sp. TaxID=1506 RepID=UPI003EE6544B
MDGYDDKEFFEKLKGNGNNTKKNQYMTIEVVGFLGDPEILYCGNSELEAYKNFRKLKGTHRKLVKADVVKSRILDTEIILEYDITEVIEDKKS